MADQENGIRRNNMDVLIGAKGLICALFGTIGAAIAALFGGWGATLGLLTGLMVADYITGLMVAGIWKKSSKSKSGALESKAGFKGLCKKCMILIFVLIAYRLDLVLGTTYLKDAVCIGFCVNELLSLTENAGLMGLPLPDVMTKAVEILKAKADK